MRFALSWLDALVLGASLLATMTMHPSHAQLARRTFVRAAVRRDVTVCWTLQYVIRTQTAVIAP
jgi:uncharacterized membrane protein